LGGGGVFPPLFRTQGPTATEVNPSPSLFFSLDVRTGTCFSSIPNPCRSEHFGSDGGRRPHSLLATRFLFSPLARQSSPLRPPPCFSRLAFAGHCLDHRKRRSDAPYGESAPPSPEARGPVGSLLSTSSSRRARLAFLPLPSAVDRRDVSLWVFRDVSSADPLRCFSKLFAAIPSSFLYAPKSPAPDILSVPVVADQLMSRTLF